MLEGSLTYQKLGLYETFKMRPSTSLLDLCSGVRAKNEGQFGLFAVTRNMNFCILPSLSHEIKEKHVFNVVYHLCDSIEDKNQSIQNSGNPHILSNSHDICYVKARGTRIFQATAQSEGN